VVNQKEFKQRKLKQLAHQHSIITNVLALRREELTWLRKRIEKKEKLVKGYKNFLTVIHRRQVYWEQQVVKPQ